jgi:hypothetical protein
MEHVMQETERYELRARHVVNLADHTPIPNRAMSKIRLWIIITDRSRPIRDILSELTDAGLVVGHVLEAIGGITGSAEDTAIDDLRKVPGVLNVWPDNCLNLARD